MHTLLADDILFDLGEVTSLHLNMTKELKSMAHKNRLATESFSLDEMRKKAVELFKKIWEALKKALTKAKDFIKMIVKKIVSLLEFKESDINSPEVRETAKNLSDGKMYLYPNTKILFNNCLYIAYITDVLKTFTESYEFSNNSNKRKTLPEHVEYVKSFIDTFAKTKQNSRMLPDATKDLMEHVTFCNKAVKTLQDPDKEKILGEVVVNQHTLLEMIDSGAIVLDVTNFIKKLQEDIDNLDKAATNLATHPAIKYMTIANGVPMEVMDNLSKTLQAINVYTAAQITTVTKAMQNINELNGHRIKAIQYLTHEASMTSNRK